VHFILTSESGLGSVTGKKEKVFPNITFKCPVHIHLTVKFKMDTTKKHCKATEKRV
jgi:hypothetical protein